MIPHPKPSKPLVAPLHGGPSVVAPMPPSPTVPSWLRAAVVRAETLEDAAAEAGAALALLDAVVLREEKWAGAWRQRLALASAAISAKRVGRVEDEAALRDALLLTRPGDDIGPAGRILLAWRGLVSRPTETLLSQTGLAAAIGGFGHSAVDRMATPGQAAFTAVFEALELLHGYRRGVDRDFGAWLADAVVAARLGWPQAAPLFAAGLAAAGGRSRSPGDGKTTAALTEESRQRLLTGFARAALQAVDLSADLGRRADRLLAIAPKLRAKGADAVIERLLADDAQAICGVAGHNSLLIGLAIVDDDAVRPAMTC